MSEQIAAVTIPPDSELPQLGGKEEQAALEASVLPDDDAANAEGLPQTPDSVPDLDGVKPADGEGAAK